MKAQRWDFAPFVFGALRDDSPGIQVTVDDRGFLRCEGRIGRIGVQTYSDGKTTWNELRPADQVFDAASMASYELAIVTNDHPGEMVSVANVKDVQAGHVGTDVRRDGDWLRVSFLVTDEKAIADIRAGKLQLSGGYAAEVERWNGTFDGVNYNYVQKNIRGNHVAIVDVGRAGPKGRLLLDGAAYQVATPTERKADSMDRLALIAKRCDVSKETLLELMKLDEKTLTDAVEAHADAEVVSLEIGGAKVKVPALAAMLITELRARLGESTLGQPAQQTPETPAEPAATPDAPTEPTSSGPPPRDPEEEEDPMADSADKLRARADAAEAKLETDRKDRDATIRRTVELSDAYRRVCGGGPLPKTDAEMTRAVILKVQPSLEAKVDANKDNPGYLSALFDASLELHEERNDAGRKTEDAAAAAARSLGVHSDDASPAESAYLKHVNDTASVKFLAAE